MSFLGDPRRRSVALLGGGVLLFLALLGAMNAFNTSDVRFLNPETSGETLAFTGLTVVVFLLLLLLLMLLLRNILKLYSDQSISALGVRLRTRMVLGAAIIALTPAVFMFFFSFLLMNRSIDRWFSPNTSELREDSTQVVLELAQYVTSNARGGGGVNCRFGCAGPAVAAAADELGSHRIKLDGGFAMVYDKDRQVLARFQAPAEMSPASLLTWQDDGSRKGRCAQRAAFDDCVAGCAAKRRAHAQDWQRRVCAGHVRHCLRQGRGGIAAHAARA